MNERVLRLVTAKHDAVGTDAEAAALDTCSKRIFEVFNKYVNTEKRKFL